MLGINHNFSLDSWPLEVSLPMHENAVTVHSLQADFKNQLQILGLFHSET